MARESKAQIAAEAALRIRQHAALRWSENPPAPDVPVPSYGDPEVHGFVYNLHAMRVSYARVGVYMAVDDDDNRLHNNPSWQQTRVPIFSTRALAVAALRHAVERNCAAQLERIDRMAAEK